MQCWFNETPACTEVPSSPFILYFQETSSEYSKNNRGHQWRIERSKWTNHNRRKALGKWLPSFFKEGGTRFQGLWPKTWIMHAQRHHPYWQHHENKTRPRANISMVSQTLLITKKQDKQLKHWVVNFKNIVCVFPAGVHTFPMFLLYHLSSGISKYIRGCPRFPCFAWTEKAQKKKTTTPNKVIISWSPSKMQLCFTSCP